jgi:hypothetical protein
MRKGFEKMNKMIAAVIAGVLLCAAPSYALMIGQMRTAETSGWGSLNLTTGIGVFEHVKHVFGTVRYGVASQLDLSGSIALLDHEANADASVLINADAQYQFMQSKLGWALDMAGGAVFEYFKVGGVSTWSLGANYIVSRPIKLDNGFAFTPYGRLNLRSDNYSYGDVKLENQGMLGQTRGRRSEFGFQKLLQSSAVGSGDKSDFNIGVNVGSVVPISSKINLIGELQIDDEFGFLAGISFFMW